MLDLLWPPTMKGYIFTAPWSMRIYSNSIESPNQGPIDFCIAKSVAGLLGHIMLIWNTPKSYHEKTIDLEWVEMTV